MQKITGVKKQYKLTIIDWTGKEVGYATLNEKPSEEEVYKMLNDHHLKNNTSSPYHSIKLEEIYFVEYDMTGMVKKFENNN